MFVWFLRLDHPFVVRGLSFLPIPMDAGVALSGEAVSVRAWAVREALVPDGKSGHLEPFVVTGGDNAVSYGLKTT